MLSPPHTHLYIFLSLVGNLPHPGFYAVAVKVFICKRPSGSGTWELKSA